MIYLCSKTVDYKYNGLAQLAHEVFHLLSPTTYKDVSVFEEAMAVYFTFQYLELINDKYKDVKEFIVELKDYYEKNDQKYWSGYQLILNNRCLALDVKKLRAFYPSKKFSQLSGTDIISINNKYNAVLISNVIEKFNT